MARDWLYVARSSIVTITCCQQIRCLKRKTARNLNITFSLQVFSVKPTDHRNIFKLWFVWQSEIHRDSLWYHVQERKLSNPVAEIIKMLKSCIYNYTGHFIRYDCWTLQSNQPIIWQQFSRHGQNSLLRFKPRVRIGNKGHFNDWLFRYKGIFPDNHLYGLQRIVQQKKGKAGKGDAKS